MKVIYHSRSENELTKSIETEFGAKRVDFDTLLRESDIVTIHVPLTRDTAHMIGAQELAIMKKDSVLINTSRGAVVDEDALYDALAKGQIRAAGLDVFQEEPVAKDNPLLDLPNVVLAPHIGSASISTRAKMAQICADNLIAALKGERPPNIVNPEVL
jgi:lactate dehydrogenase-like 2-hydroxyacid dehydrogenase